MCSYYDLIELYFICLFLLWLSFSATAAAFMAPLGVAALTVAAQMSRRWEIMAFCHQVSGVQSAHKRNANTLAGYIDLAPGFYVLDF